LQRILQFTDKKSQTVLVKTKKECIFAPAIKQHAAVA